ncbi:MAG: HEAT repeat domain-containing protein [Haloarculaceae archaeon]
MSRYDNRSARGRKPDGLDQSALRDLLARDDAWRRRDAALGLVDAAADGLDPETADALAETARTDDDADVRQFAVEALGVAGERPDAIRAALDDPQEWVRAEAVVALSRAAHDDVETLRAALDDDSGWVRRNAVIALGKVDAVAGDRLVDCIKTDPVPAVREYAAQYLGDAATDVRRAERILSALLARDPNAFVRAKAAESLGTLGTDRAERALESHGVTDASDDVVRTASRALASARGVAVDELDAPEVETEAPGTGPDAPADGSHSGFRSRRPGAPGGGPGFDPRKHLETDPGNRRS